MDIQAGPGSSRPSKALDQCTKHERGEDNPVFRSNGEGGVDNLLSERSGREKRLRLTGYCSEQRHISAGPADGRGVAVVGAVGVFAGHFDECGWLAV